MRGGMSIAMLEAYAIAVVMLLSNIVWLWMLVEVYEEEREKED